MKINKSTYFAFFFLFCFLASFSANTFKHINASVSKSSINHSKTTSVSSKENSSDIENELLFEENENKSENNLGTLSFILPFFVSYFHSETLQPIVFSEKLLTEKLSNPIYISVCNFRI